MSTIGKSIATTISMIVVVLSLAVVNPTTARGNGKRTGSPARFQQSHNLKARNVSTRSAVLGTSNPKWGLPTVSLDYMGSPVVTYSRRRNPNHGKIATRRANQMFHGTSGDGEK